MRSTASTTPTTSRGPRDSAASPDAAIAAAAHTVLVGVVNSFGTPAQKGAALALVEQAYAHVDRRASPTGPARNQGVAVGRAAGAAMLALRKDDGATRDAPYTPGMGPGKWRPHPNPVPRQPAHRQSGRGSRLPAPRRFRAGKRHAVHPAFGIAVLASRAAGVDERHLRAGLQRGEERRRQGQHGPHGRPDADRALLVRGPGRVEQHRAHGGDLAQPRRQGQRPGPGPHEHGDGGRLHRGLQDPLRVRPRGAR